MESHWARQQKASTAQTASQQVKLAQPAPVPAVQQSWLELPQSPAVADRESSVTAQPRTASTRAHEAIDLNIDRRGRIVGAYQQTKPRRDDRTRKLSDHAGQRSTELRSFCVIGQK
jgi:hypothetical protein